MHEVVVTARTRDAIAAAIAAAAAAAGDAAAAGAAADDGGDDARGAGGDQAPGPPHLWRVSSTLFAHVNSHASLRPLLAAPPDRLLRAALAAGVAPPAVAPGNYPETSAGAQVVAELRGIALAKS
jgi:hypothetical protein